MKKINIETGVGIFIVLGLLCLAYVSVKLGDVQLFGTKQYILKARFANISGLKEGAVVEIAGVTVGKVGKVHLNNYEALVDLFIDPEVKLQEDSIASVRTQGIIGDKFVRIKPGGSEKYLKPGGDVLETESAIELEELISKYIFEKENK
ncbi:MAG: outer membrane lipid asymmetry maintenance protein MlaD [Nitrospirae bacterium]|nr:outer membrane lipid asymmetry maintenance protein MlaD [Nitrospirota bacterium]